MLLKLAFKNVISRKSSYVIIIFMTFAVMLFCVANAVFDSTEKGVQNCYVSSFTGDLMVRPKASVQLSLFGDETPLTGEFTELENLVPYADIVRAVHSVSGSAEVLGQVTGVARMEFKDTRDYMYLFGVSGEEYISAMPSVSIVEGVPYERGEKGMMISSAVAEKWNAHVGDVIQFAISDGQVFRIRAATVTAIFAYQTENAIFNRFVLVDPDTVRSVMDISDTVESSQADVNENKSYMLADDLDLDDLFSDAADTDAVWEAEDEPAAVAAVPVPVAEPAQESMTWNFLIVKLQDSRQANLVIKRLNAEFRRNGWPAEAVDWRHAAGSTALYLYWLRTIFNIGILIVLMAGFIIVANSLVVSVLDRTKEIGTLRAIGAKKRFISAQCLAETLMMTLTSGVLGVLCGILVSSLITRAHIVFGNDFLVQLFGSSALEVSVSVRNVFRQLALVIVLGVIGWLYPVVAALQVSPVRAMQGAK